MSWLEDRLAKWGPFRRGAAAVADREDAAETRAFETNHPPLMLLVNDASGRASFKTHVFADAESATDFVLYWFPNQSQGGIIAFWAMTEPPEFGLDSPSETAPEAVVMIRDVTRDGVVYLFSFVDITSAQAFLREEVRHGTDFSLMMLYWAVPVRLTADPWGKMMLTPSMPPGVAYDAADEPVAQDLWSPPPAAPAMEVARQEPEEDARAVFEEAPNAHTGVADPMGGIDDSFELTAWMDRPGKKRSREKNADAKIERQAHEEDGRDVFEEAPNAHTGIADPAGGTFDSFDLTSWVERAREKRSTEDGARIEPQDRPDPDRGERATTHFEPRPASNVTPEPSVESEMAAPATEPAADVPPVVEDIPQEVPMTEAPVVENATREDEPTPPEETPAPEIEKPPVHPSIELRGSGSRVHTNGNGHRPIESAEDKQSLNGPEVVAKPPRKARRNGHGAEDAIRPAHADKHEAGEPADLHATEEIATPAGEAGEAQGDDENVNPGLEIRIDIHLDSSRALKIKRWEVKEEPFDGFNSPPGRF